MLKTSNQTESTLLEEIFNYQKKLFNQEALACYIAPQVIHFTGDDHPEDAFTEIKRWLEGNQSTLLLLGDSGAGKTLFNQWLTQTLFEARLKDDQTYPIPLFIPLLAQSRAKTHLLLDYFRDTLCLDSKNMDWLEQQPLLLILDGFDELYERTNLYLSNKLWNYKAKVLISCRSQALANVTDKSLFFVPYDQKEQPQKFQLCEWTIAPFNQNQIDAYLSQYIKQHTATIKTWMAEHSNSGNWLEVQTYRTAFKQFYTLKELVTSPFVLHLVAQVLPEVMLKPDLKMARLHLYDVFTEQWFERQRKKLIEAQHIKIDTPIVEAYRIYSKKLAETMLQQKVSSILYIPEEEKKQTMAEMFQSLTQPINPFKWFFEEKDIELPSKEKIRLSYIRAGVPLVQIGTNQFAFIHKSLLEYFAARHLFESVMAEASLALGLGLNEKLLMDEPDTMRFIVDQVRENVSLQKSLFQILEESKHESRLEIAASNAVTLLHRANISLRGRDFRSVRIRKADLSGALLDDCDFREADLREVNLHLASLSHVQMSGALMQDIFLGQKPAIEVGSGVNAITYSPKGDILAVGCFNATIKLYHPGQAKPFKVLKTNIEAVGTLAFNPNGLILASGTGNNLNHKDNTIRLWNLNSGQGFRTLEGHTAAVNALTFSLDGNTLASGSTDKTIRLWNPHSGQSFGTLEGHTEWVSALIFSPDGTTLASGSLDQIRLWNPNSGEVIRTLKGHMGAVNALIFSPDGNTLVSGSYDNTVRLWNPNSGQGIRTLEGHTDSVKALTFNPDGLILASGSADKTIRLWNPTSGQAIRTLEGHMDSVNTLTFSPDGLILLSGGGPFDQTIRLWNPNFRQDIRTEERRTIGIRALAFSPDGLILASGDSGNNTIRLWNPNSGQDIHTLEGHTAAVNTLTFNPDGLILASGSADKTIRLWNPASGQTIRTLEEHTESVHTLTFSPNGHTLASSSSDQTIRLWNLNSGQSVSTSWGMTYNYILAITFSPDGTTLASGFSDRTIALLDSNSGQHIRTLKGYSYKINPKGHKDKVNALSFSPDGTTLASGSKDKTICLWNPTNGECIYTLEGHTNSVNTLSFSPDGTTLASGSDDKTIRLWDRKKKIPLRIFSFKGLINHITWQKNQYFALIIGNAIECGIMKDNQLTCLWRTRQYLNSQYTQLGGVVGLTEEDYNLLNQEGGEGTPSTKTTEKILEQRQSARPYNRKKLTYSLLSQGHLVSPSMAVVSMVKKKSNFHVFLVIETVEDNFCIIRQADFFLDQKQASLQIGLFAKGKAIIEMVQKTEFDMEQLLAEGCQTKSWQIDSKDANKLIDLITQDQNARKNYANFVNEVFNADSCLTWCEGKLTQIGIDISKQKSWLDVLVALPAIHMKEEKPKSKFKLSLPFFKIKSSDDENNNNDASSSSKQYK